MKTRFALRVGLIGGLALSSSGCAFLFADGAPDRHQELLYFDCTSTPGLSVADGFIALSSGLAAADNLSKTDGEFERQNDGGNRSATAGTQIAVGAVFVASAVYGIVVTENCKSAKGELRQRLIERARQRPAPRPLSPAVPALVPATSGSVPGAAEPPAPAPTAPAATPPPAPAPAPSPTPPTSEPPASPAPAAPPPATTPSNTGSF